MAKKKTTTKTAGADQANSSNQELLTEAAEANKTAGPKYSPDWGYIAGDNDLLDRLNSVYEIANRDYSHKTHKEAMDFLRGTPELTGLLERIDAQVLAYIQNEYGSPIDVGDLLDQAAKEKGKKLTNAEYLDIVSKANDADRLTCLGRGNSDDAFFRPAWFRRVMGYGDENGNFDTLSWVVRIVGTYWLRNETAPAVKAKAKKDPALMATVAEKRADVAGLKKSAQLLKEHGQSDKDLAAMGITKASIKQAEAELAALEAQLDQL